MPVREPPPKNRLGTVDFPDRDYAGLGTVFSNAPAWKPFETWVNCMDKSLPRSTRIDIPTKARKELVALLNPILGSLLDLWSQVKQAHWNIHGANFIAIHEFLDKLADSLTDQVDEVAERIVQLGGVAEGTIRMGAKSTILKESESGVLPIPSALEALADRYAKIGALIRKEIEHSDELGDPNTADILTGIGNDLDKNLWFIESHLGKS